MKDVLKRLKKLDAKEAKKIIRQSLREAMRPMFKDVKSNAPVGETHDLKEDVKLRAGKKSRRSISMNIYLHHADADEKFHAAFVEYGTSKQKPNPFMRRAFDQDKEAAASMASAAILRRLVDLLGKGKSTQESGDQS